jgi:hypothetical protein
LARLRNGCQRSPPKRLRISGPWKWQARFKWNFSKRWKNPAWISESTKRFCDEVTLEKPVTLTILDERLRFPNPAQADAEAWWPLGDLSVPRLLLAYRSGIFPGQQTR